MKIAQIAPLFESVPPKYYGGTERVVSFLTEELVQQGHDVTLFASGDSKTRAHLVACSERSLRFDRYCEDQLAHHFVLLDTVFRTAHEFDILHNHIDYLSYPLLKRQKTPHITTLHGRLNISDLVPLYRQYSNIPLVSISDAQRNPIPGANWLRTIYHGLPSNLLTFHEEAGKYIAFMGRISPEKRVDRAIKIAKRLGMEIRIAAKVDEKDRSYFEEVVKPLLKDPLVDYVGEIGKREKDDFLGNAYAFIFPIDWPEPFGLVMIEAMACGTPVIAYRNGAIPEIIQDGVNGFVVDGFEAAVRAVDRVSKISRRRCREVFEERFTAERMAHEYLKIYELLIQEKREYAFEQ